MESPVPGNIVLITQEADRPHLLRRALEHHPYGSQANLQAFRLADADDADVGAALRSAHVILLSHILVEEAEARVLRWLDTAAPADATIVPIACLGPIMQRMRMGRFTLGKGGPPPLAMLKSFGIQPDDSGDLTSLFQGILQQAHKIIDHLPPPLIDLKTYLQSCLYWTAPSQDNLAHLVLSLLNRYAPCIIDPDSIAPPEIFADCGGYIPNEGIVNTFPAQTATPAKPVLGILVARGPILSGSTHVIDAFCELARQHQLEPRVVFAESFDFRKAVSQFLSDDPNLGALLNLSGFPLVGGHNRSLPSEARAFLDELGVPYFTPSALMLQSEHSWKRNSLGLDPMELAMQVAVHELEGGLEPMVVHGMANLDGEPKSLINERADRLLRRVRRWVALRNKPNHAKRIFLSVFAFPPGKGATGTAAYLDVFQSTYRALKELKAHGFTVDMPESADHLLRMLVCGGDPHAPHHQAELHIAARLSIEEYRGIAPESHRIDKMWGPPPGSLNSDGDQLVIHGVQLGNVLVGVQPSFGFDGDPMRLLFERGATPHHGFLAHYRYGQEIFKADAFVHMGTHGALEFMPGKQCGLSERCWPDILVGDVPHVYLYAINNPSEGSIAKRRGQALTVSHLTPPCEESGLYRVLLTLRELLEAYSKDTNEERRTTIVESMNGALSQSNLDEIGQIPTSGPRRDSQIADLTTLLLEIESRRIPVGLHTIGRQPESPEIIEILTSLACSLEVEHSLLDLILAEQEIASDEYEQHLQARDSTWMTKDRELRQQVRRIMAGLAADALEPASERFNELIPSDSLRSTAKHRITRLAEVRQTLIGGDELRPLLSALTGRYVSPGPGGDPSRSPDVLPTGRNLHATDPAALPSPAAERMARKAVRALLDKHRSETGHYPSHLGFVLWGLDNIKTQGEGIAQVLELLGVRAQKNSIGRVALLKVISTEELGRPRVDVSVQASGIFRDLFGHHMALIDKAVRLVASLDEDPSVNPIRARSNRLMEEGFNEHQARSRVFSNAPGAYGTHIDHMVGMSLWEERSDLAASFVRRKSFQFGAEAQGDSAAPLLEALAKDVDGVVQNVDSAEVSLTDVDHYFEYLGGLGALVEKANGKRPTTHVLDATTGALSVRSLDEALRLESRTKILNPKWREGMLRHGYEGAEEIRKRLEYTFGWSATADAVPSWFYGDVLRDYVRDEDVRRRMAEANPSAFRGLLDRLAEAETRGFWDATNKDRELLQDQRDLQEDLLEQI